jgi:hypothetical protein
LEVQQRCSHRRQDVQIKSAHAVPQAGDFKQPRDVRDGGENDGDGHDAPTTAPFQVGRFQPDMGNSPLREGQRNAATHSIVSLPIL